MRHISWLVTVFVLGLFLQTPWVWGQIRNVEMTQVEATIIGPDGKPVVNTSVVFTDLDEQTAFPDKPMRVQAVTDDHGVAHFQWRTGVSQMLVKAKGVGYGVCGLNEYMPNVSNKPYFPPLAPYPTITGTIPKELIGKATSVQAQHAFDGNNSCEVSIDQAGRFEFTDLLIGRWFLYLQGDQLQTRATARVELNPGLHFKEVKFEIIQPPPIPNDADIDLKMQERLLNWGRKRGESVFDVRGVIRDIKGAPLPGVDVYAVVYYDYGPGMHAQIDDPTYKTTTDQNGHYEFEGKGGSSGVIIAYSKAWPRRQLNLANPTRWNLAKNRQPANPGTALI